MLQPASDKLFQLEQALQNLQAYNLPGISSLVDLARQATNQPQLVITNWEVEPVPVLAMSATTLGLYRLKGNGYIPTNDASEPAAQLNWSVIIKMLYKYTNKQTAQTLGYWRREQLVYQSGILNHALPTGLRLPRCFAITRPLTLPDAPGHKKPGDQNEVWLWLEELQDAYALNWPLALYNQVASYLGQFQGYYLTNQLALPEQNWLCRDYLRDYLRIYGHNYAKLLANRSWELPALKSLFGGQFAKKLEIIESRRESFFEAMNKLPLTLTHSDFHRDNLMACRPITSFVQPANGISGEVQFEIGVIDWADLGINWLGQDLAALVGLSLGAYKDNLTDPYLLDKTIFPVYLARLYEAGWQGEEQVVRLGFSAAVALRWSCALARNVGWVVLDQRQEWLEQAYGSSIQKCLERWAELGWYVMERAEEAWELIGQLERTHYTMVTPGFSGGGTRSNT